MPHCRHALFHEKTASCKNQFLDATMHLYEAASVRQLVRPSVRPSIRPSVRRMVPWHFQTTMLSLLSFSWNKGSQPLTDCSWLSFDPHWISCPSEHGKWHSLLFKSYTGPTDRWTYRQIERRRWTDTTFYRDGTMHGCDFDGSYNSHI